MLTFPPAVTSSAVALPVSLTCISLHTRPCTRRRSKFFSGLVYSNCSWGNLQNMTQGNYIKSIFLKHARWFQFYMCICMKPHTHAHTQLTHTCMHACMNTQVHVHMPTCPHKTTQLHIFIQFFSLWVNKCSLFLMWGTKLINITTYF